MSGYIGPAPVPQATQTRQTFTATSGQTSFATIGYVAGGQFIQVYLNGVLLKLTDDYTAANGSDIVLTSGAATGDILEFITFADFTVNNQNFTGGLTVDNDGSTVLTVDRATSDGTIIDVQKAGSSVGSIGTDYDAGIYVGGGTSALFYNQTTAGLIQPYSVTGGAVSDGVVQLGEATSRFKDLYLSGGVYLGGTGSANKLDDYEEGTFTYSGSVANLTSLNTSEKRYIKIGNQVTLWMKASFDVTAADTRTFISITLPFNTATNTTVISGGGLVEGPSPFKGISAGAGDSSQATSTSGYWSFVPITTGAHTAFLSLTYVAS